MDESTTLLHTPNNQLSAAVASAMALLENTARPKSDDLGQPPETFDNDDDGISFVNPFERSNSDAMAMSSGMKRLIPESMLASKDLMYDDTDAAGTAAQLAMNSSMYQQWVEGNEKHTEYMDENGNTKTRDTLLKEAIAAMADEKMIVNPEGTFRRNWDFIQIALLMCAAGTQLVFRLFYVHHVDRVARSSVLPTAPPPPVPHCSQLTVPYSLPLMLCTGMSRSACRTG